ncbi:MAG TPA: chromosome segregation protein SMC [Myxococcaceae bacterium]|nr:chromosome segregation protein SMC [Myxococcaceae bacterium]
MRIQRLDITGFKSFTERSVFSFGDGVSGIVGPNGCGKSNVVDAIRWVMGEQSAKSLRGRAMEDVIFSGSESKPALAMAEVSLTVRLEDGDAVAPQYAGFAELTVTRRLFRDGESEYLINKTPCRLLDIVELFLGTGVGTRAYSIVEQGRVGFIVSAKPEDRRAFIDEASGVTKYKARRKIAERKMEYTQQNLLRVNDIVVELQSRLEALARQAKKADRYKKIKAQMREIELHVASHSFLELHGKAKALQAKVEALGAEEKSLFQSVRALEDGIQGDRRTLEADDEVLQRLQQDRHELESQVQLADERLGHWKQDAEAAQQRIERDGEELRSLQGRRSELEVAIADADERRKIDEASWKEDEVAVQVAQEGLRRMMRLERELLDRQAQQRQSLVQIASSLASQQSELANLTRRGEELAGEGARLQAERGQLRAEEQQVDERRHQLAQRIVDRRVAAVELAQRRGAEQLDLEEARQQFAESEIAVISLREDLAEKRARLSSLEQIQRNYEGFDRGVRAVMLKGSSEAQESGARAVVADVVSAPPHFEKAIEAALGDRLQSVIVDSRDRAIELIEHLKATAEGRSTFLPLRSSEAPKAALELSHPGIVALAADQVSCEPAFAPLVRSLLAGVVIVADLATAKALAQSTAAGLTLVTLDGEVMRPDGSITGGALEGPAIGALQKKREIAELSTEVAAAEQGYNEVLTRHYGLQKRMHQSEGVLKGLAQTQHAEAIELAADEKDLQKAAEDLLRLRQQLAAVEQRICAGDAGLAELQTTEQQIRGELAQTQLERGAREETLEQIGHELEALKRRSEEASDQLTRMSVRAASNAQRAQAAQKELAQLRDQLEEMTLRWQRLEGAIAEAKKKREELAQSIGLTTADREAQAQRLRLRQEELDEKRRAHADLAAHIRADDDRLRELRTRLDQLTDGLSALSIEERELAMALEHLIEQVRDRHQLELADELHRFHLAVLPDNHEARLRDLRSQLDRIGDINLTAIDEHAEVSSRCEFLRGQQKDLEASLVQLRQAIGRIDRTSRERFKKTFELVNERFQAVFPRLFGGGRASLTLVDPEAGGEPGVEIFAQPPGKKLQNVNLLSGGEKALTAVSLIFAIFLVKPTPFCILDEVDAPLDEANVGRYNDMVREISKQCQFILITHNKRTMEMLDTLYGVTMEEPGVSKLVSVRMTDAPAAEDHQAA